MLAWVVLRRLWPYVLGSVLILSVGLWIFSTGYSSGVDDTVRKYEVKIQEERNRQQSANQAALENARQREAELRRLINERNATISDLNMEAQKDPTARRPAVSVDGVRRINRIR